MSGLIFFLMMKAFVASNLISFKVIAIFSIVVVATFGAEGIVLAETCRVSNFKTIKALSWGFIVVGTSEVHSFVE